MTFDQAIYLCTGGALLASGFLLLALVLTEWKENPMAKKPILGNPHKKGFFVTFEGIDGTGKTTQIQRTAAKFTGRFENLKDNLIVVKEPGDLVDGKYIGSELGAKVREILFFDPVLKASTGVLHEEPRDLLFLADHIQLWKRTILPALEQNKVVLCDRYADSQFAYGPGKNGSLWIRDLYIQRYGPIPDVIILLTGDPETLVSRTQRTGTEAGKQEGKSWSAVDRQATIQSAYLHMLGGRTNVSIINIDSKSIEEVTEDIWGVVSHKYDTKWTRPSGPEQLELNSQADGYFGDDRDLADAAYRNDISRER